MLDFAAAYADTLHVVVLVFKNQLEVGINRITQLQAYAPSIHIHQLVLDQTQSDPERYDAIETATPRLLDLLPSQPHVVIGDGNRLSVLAHRLGARHIPLGVTSDFQTDRKSRDDHKLTNTAHAACHKVAIIGPQSTGKSTLAQQLASHFATVWVPEYARIFADNKPSPLDQHDVELIARGQIAAETTFFDRSNRRLFVDTEAIMTRLYAQIYYGQCPSWIEQVAANRHYDLYLLTAPDVPWVSDPQRDLPNQREEFFAACARAVLAKGARHEIITGDWSTRLQRAIAAVERLEIIPNKAKGLERTGC